MYDVPNRFILASSNEITRQVYFSFLSFLRSSSCEIAIVGNKVDVEWVSEREEKVFLGKGKSLVIVVEMKEEDEWEVRRKKRISTAKEREFVADEAKKEENFKMKINKTRTFLLLLLRLRVTRCDFEFRLDFHPLLSCLLQLEHEPRRGNFHHMTKRFFLIFFYRRACGRDVLLGMVEWPHFHSRVFLRISISPFLH